LTLGPVPATTVKPPEEEETKDDFKKRQTAVLRKKIEEQRRKSRLTVKKSSDKFEVSQESNGSLRRWTTLTKLDLKLSGSKSTLQSDAGKDLHVVDEQER